MRTSTDEQARAPRGRPTTRQPALRGVPGLQRSIGNRAVTQLIQRKLSYQTPPTGKSTTPKKVPVNTKASLPAAPLSVSTAYTASHLEKVKATLEGYISDKEQRQFASLDAMWSETAQALLADAAPTAAPADTVGRDNGAWKAIKIKLDAGNGVIATDWSMFKAGQQQELLAVLSTVDVQVSSNPKTNAWHKNDHGLLPKANAAGPLRRDNTPYVEFLIKNQKNANEIERAIFDRENNLVYVTDHYKKFVWLRGVPGAVTANMSTKAATYFDDTLAPDPEANGDE